MFEQYNNEFNSLVNLIEDALSDVESGSSSGNTSDEQIQNLLQQCDDLIKQMSLEARSVSDTNQKREFLQKVREHKSSIQTLTDRANQQTLFSTSNGVGGGGGGSSNAAAVAASRERLLKNEGMLANQNDTLDHARRVMEETEAVALEITEELGHNREKLMSAHGRVREVTNMTGRARRLLQTMNQRNMQQKFVMYGVFAGFVILFFFFILGLR